MSEKDRGNLLAILDACSKIRRFVKDHSTADSFYEDEETFDAVLLNFVVIGEAVARLSDEMKDHNPSIPWKQIRGFHNLVAHDYFGVDAEEVWQIINRHLPVFTADIQTILEK